MKNAFIILSLILFQADMPSIGKTEVKRAISIFLEKGILNSQHDTLFIQLENIHISEEKISFVTHEMDTLHLNHKRKDIPFIKLQQLQHSKNDNIVVKFKVNGEGGYLYKGEILFEYLDNKFVDKTCNYYTAIE